MGNHISYNITYEVFWIGSTKYNNDQPVNCRWIYLANESARMQVDHISYNNLPIQFNFVELIPAVINLLEIWKQNKCDCSKQNTGIQVFGILKIILYLR